MALVLGFFQTESFWDASDLKQCICHYSIHVLIVLTVPWFTIGEHVSSMTRQSFIAALAQITYVSMFPPPLLHALIGMYFMPVYFLYRTHAFNMLASEHQKTVQHSAAECTICAFKSFTLISAMMYYRVVPVKMALNMPYDN